MGTVDDSPESEEYSVERTSLGGRLFLYVVFLGLLITIVFAAIEVTQDYHARYAELEAALESIEGGYLPAVSQSLFDFNTTQLDLLLAGIVLLRDVSFAQVVETPPGGEVIVATQGRLLQSDFVERSFPLLVEFQGQIRQIGRLEVQAGVAHIRSLVANRVARLVVISALEAFAVALLVWYVLEKSVVRHLRAIAKQIARVRLPAVPSVGVELKRPPKSDELSDIVEALNEAYVRLAASHSELRVSLENKNTLLQELYHRTKNNMQTIAAIMTLRAAEAPDSKEVHDLVQETNARIQAMALVHEKLYQSHDLSRVQLKEYLTDLLESLVSIYQEKREIVSTVSGAESTLLLDTAIPVGLVVAELVSNSMKHAFGADQSGSLAIELESSAGELRLTYRDSGAGLPEGFEPKRDGGVGLRTVVALVEGQLGGHFRVLSSGPEPLRGVAYEITLVDDQYTERVRQP